VWSRSVGFWVLFLTLCYKGPVGVGDSTLRCPGFKFVAEAGLRLNSRNRSWPLSPGTKEFG
jgi:hypothetical protein